MTPDELPLLIARAADGSLTPAESTQLLAACRENPAVLAELTDHLTTERLLLATERDPRGRTTAQEIALRIEQERLASVVAPTFVPRVLATAHRHSTRHILSRWALAAAALILAGAYIWLQTIADPSDAEGFYESSKPSSLASAGAPVAVLKRSLSVVWENPANAPGTGQTLGPGWLRLRSGTVQVEFLSGAWLVLSGPAELRLDSPSAGFLQRGRVSAYVPEVAHGFSLSTPVMKVVDLGTAFGVDASQGRSPEVHVFNGAVSVARLNDPARKLSSGEALRLDRDGFVSIPAQPSAFPNGEALAHQADSLAKERATKWREAMTQLAADPTALASFTFEDEQAWSRTVTNRAFQASTDSTAAMIGAGWTGGRWTGKPGIEFRSQGDRLRFSIPGTYAQVTMMAWVRVDSLPNDYNSLLMPSRYGVGVMHWTLERSGELRLAMLNHDYKQLRTDGWEGPISATTITDMDFGRWVFLATTYDSKTGSVAHYRDGQKVGEGAFRKKLPAVFNEIQFGNWGADGSDPSNRWVKSQPRHQRLRNFVGRLDELNVLARVLDSAEIARLYEIGKP